MVDSEGGCVARIKLKEFHKLWMLIRLCWRLLGKLLCMLGGINILRLVISEIVI